MVTFILSQLQFDVCVTVHSIHRRQAHLCVLANNCDEAMYVKLVEALCAEHGINIIKVRKQWPEAKDN